MGLVQREIEAAGLAAVTLSTIWSLTASVGVPRLVAIEHPQGRIMGATGDSERQRAVLSAALHAVSVMTMPGSIEHLPFEWGESASKARSHAFPAPPIAQYLKRHPWQLPRLLNRDIPE